MRILEMGASTVMSIATNAPAQRPVSRRSLEWFDERRITVIRMKVMTTS
jgi:hypothetical protein